MRVCSWSAVSLALLILLLAAVPAGVEAQSVSAAPAAPQIRIQLGAPGHTVLSSEISGKITGLALREGDSFAMGDRLIGFHCAVEMARQQAASAHVRAMEKTLESKRRLLKLNSIGPLDVAIAEAEADKARAEYATQTAIVDTCRIEAPFDGKVATVHVSRYQYVTVGEPLLEILDDSTLELEMIVPSSWLAWLAPGTRFTVRIDETGGDYGAEITHVGAHVDAISQSVKVIGRITDDFAGLISGMSGWAQFATQEPAP